MDKKINIDLIIERSMTAFNCTTQRQLADIFKISPEDFSSRKRRGTLTKLIEKESFRRDISYDWLKTGEGSMKSSDGVAEPQTPYNANSTAPRISELLSKTAAVLESPTIFSHALRSNIEAFHTAVTCEAQLAVASKRIDDLEEHVKLIEERLPKVVSGS
jgi:hypothetical protein